MNIAKSSSSSKSNIKFCGIYALRGDTKAVESGIDWVTKKLTEDRLHFAFKKIQKSKDETIIGIATNRNIDDTKKPWFSETAQKRVIEALDLLNPTKIIRFNSLNGFNEKAQRFYEDGKEFLCSVYTREYDKVKTINQIRFDEPKPLREALSELFTIPSGLTFERETYSFDKSGVKRLLNHNEKEIKKCNDMNKFDIKGFCGSGGSSTALELANGDCLKLSNFPNAPLEDAIYDIKTIFKDKMKLDATYKRSPFRESDFFYYTVQKKGLSHKEHFITREHVAQIEHQMTELEHYWDPGELQECQIALLDGKPYLIDAQVPVNRPLFE